MTAFTLGAPLSLGLAISAMGAGLLTSGLGTLAASVGVLRHPDPVPRLLRASAAAGAPLGGALTVLGAASLSLWPPLLSTVGVVTPVAAALGVVVVVLLVVALVVGLRGEVEDAE